MSNNEPTIAFDDDNRPVLAVHPEVYGPDEPDQADNAQAPASQTDASREARETFQKMMKPIFRSADSNTRRLYCVVGRMAGYTVGELSVILKISQTNVYRHLQTACQNSPQVCQVLTQRSHFE